MKKIQKQWLGSVPWEKVLTVNQTLCQAQNTAFQRKAQAFEAARQLWEKSVPKSMSLPEVLDICRKCFDLAPFVFNNGNTFATISKTLIEDWAQYLPGVEAQILRTTVSHYVAGQVEKRELLQVLHHFENGWKNPPAGQSVQSVLQKRQEDPAVP